MTNKKIKPLFVEPVKTPTVAKKPIAKKEVPIVKPKIDKKEVAGVKEKKTSIGTIPSPDSKKEIEPKPRVAKSPHKKVITTKKPIIKEGKKVLSKPQNPPVKKVTTPKVKEIKIEEQEEETEVIEKKPAYIKEVKRNTKINKNSAPINKKHKLKLGTKVIVTFLGQPEKGAIIELTEEGMYKVKADRGVILPRAKYEGGEILDKRYPSYIIKVL